MTKENTVKLQFNWQSATPDCRQYNQQRQLLIPVSTYDTDGFPLPIKVEINIPCNHEMVANADKIIQAQLSTSDEVPDPILTPKGLFYAVSLLEAPFANAELSKKEEKQDLDNEWAEEGWKDDDNTEWDDDKTEEDNTWEDDIDTDETQSDDDIPDWEDEETWEAK